VKRPPSKKPRSSKKDLAYYQKLAREDVKAFAEMVWKTNRGERIVLAAHHRKELEFLARAYHQNIPCLVLAPMGSGKSELGMAFLLWLINRDPRGRFGIVCDKDEHAGQRVTAIRRYIQHDDDQRRLFPEVKVGGGRENVQQFRLTANTFAKDESVSGAGVTSSGTGSRRDVIFFDDICTERNTILNPAERSRVSAGFTGTWLSRIEPKTGWWFYIGTVYASDDVTHAVMSMPHAAVLKIGVSEDFKEYDVMERWPDEEPQEYNLPLWEGKWDEEAYRHKYITFVKAGESTKWFSGYRNMVIDPDAASFKKPWFKRTVLEPEYRLWPVVLYVDPASSQDKKADFYAGVVLGWDRKRKAAVVLHKWKVREGLKERIDRYLDAYEAWVPQDDGVEGRHELSFRQALKIAARDRGSRAKIRAIDHGPDSDKEGRIQTLAPLLERGSILFDGAVHPEFWDEAETFPRAKNDDLLDALEGAYSMLHRLVWRRKGARNFNPNEQRDRPATPTANKNIRRVPKPSDGYVTRERNARDLLWR
jgi:predicted phage terminase large subunit-like protein